MGKRALAVVWLTTLVVVGGAFLRVRAQDVEPIPSAATSKRHVPGGDRDAVIYAVAGVSLLVAGGALMTYTSRRRPVRMREPVRLVKRRRKPSRARPQRSRRARHAEAKRRRKAKTLTTRRRVRPVRAEVRAVNGHASDAVKRLRKDVRWWNGRS